MKLFHFTLGNVNIRAKQITETESKYRAKHVYEFFEGILEKENKSSV